MKLNPSKTGLVVGTFSGLLHTVWGLLVALGLAAVIQNWILDIHFLNNPFTIQPFDITKWITLVIATTIIGYIFGYILANIWNKINR